MTILDGGLLGVSVGAALTMGVIAIALALVRLLRGPTLPDRVIALDVVANVAVALIAAAAVAFDEPVLMQPALVIAVAAFVGTVAFAHHLERPESGRSEGAR